MDSKIRIYQVEFKPDQNAVVESLQQYLKTATLRYKSDTFQYQQIAIDMVIKVPMEQSQLNIPGNYVEIIQDNIHYYFYIMNAKWTAKNTLRLVLSMDTLNTFWTEIQACLDKQTHVSRKYYDRWKRVDTKIYPLIDNHPEDITQPYMRRNNNVYVVGPTEHWTLVYITEYDNNDLNKNPISCLALPDTDKTMDGTLPNTVQYDSFPDGTMCVLDYAHAPNAAISWSGGSYTLDSSSAKVVFVFSQKSKTIALRQYKMGEGWVITSIPGTATITGTSVLYKQPANFEMDIDEKFWQFDDPVQFLGAVVPSFAKWFDSHKTDQRLVKIMELPYAPFTVSYTAAGNLILPDGWEMTTEGALRLKSGAVKFSSHVYKYPSLGPQSIDIHTLSLTEQAEPLLYETKLWNSNYYTYKFIYDNNVHVVKLEDFTQPGATPAYGVEVSFEASTGMDGSILFKFDSNEIVDSDFGEYLVCNRTTEIPYYTNEYLNYMRYGKAVDERNKRLSTASTLVSGVGSAVQTSASLAFAVANAGIGALTGGIGAIAGGVIGLAATTIATASSIFKAQDQINSKIDNYTHQASGVSAANDLSVFRTYGKNKLLLTAYEPVYELKESIGRYFELYGYSCDIYGVPNLKTRIWSDYFVMEPVFYQNPILEAYQEDIATRMKAGFRIFHRNDDISNENGVLIHYDFNNEYENWERSITGR